MGSYSPAGHPQHHRHLQSQRCPQPHWAPQPIGTPSPMGVHNPAGCPQPHRYLLPHRHPQPHGHLQPHGDPQPPWGPMAPTAPWGPTGTRSPAGSHTCSAEEQERGHAAAEQVEALHGGCQELPASHCLYLYGGKRAWGRAGRLAAAGTASTDAAVVAAFLIPGGPGDGDRDGAEHGDSAAAPGKARVRDVMARDTFWRGGPGVTLPTWGHRPHHGILLAWGRGSPWAAPSSCSPFLAGAGFHGGGETSIRALRCHPSVPKGRCPQVPHPGLIWDLLEPPQVTNSRRCHSPDRQGDMSPPPWGRPHHRWHHAGSMPWGMAAAGDTRSPAHVTLTCRGRPCSAVPKAWP